MLNFFGLTPSDKIDLYLEPWFILQYYGGFTWSEYDRLPVVYKKWWLDRITKEINRSQESGEGAQTRGAQHNTAEMRGLQNMTNQNPPARLRRFT